MAEQETLVPPIFATDDFNLNMGTVGVPYMLQAEECRKTNQASESWAVYVAAGDIQRLTFRMEPESNFWLDSVTCHVYEVTLQVQTDNKLLTPVDATTDLAPIIIRVNDSRQDWQRNGMLWNNLAGRGTALHWLGIPHVIYGGNAITATLENQHATKNYAVCFILHGRKRKSYRSGGGGIDPEPDPKWMSALTAKQRLEGFGQRIALAHDNAENLKRVGVTHWMAPEDHTDLTGDASWTGMNAYSETMFNDPNYNFFARYARYMSHNASKVLVQGPPVFIQVTDDRFKYAWSNMPVPVDACCGLTGGRPYVMPVDWVWEARGTTKIDIYSAVHDGAQKLWLSFEGWWRAGR